MNEVQRGFVCSSGRRPHRRSVRPGHVGALDINEKVLPHESDHKKHHYFAEIRISNSRKRKFQRDPDLKKKYGMVFDRGYAIRLTERIQRKKKVNHFHDVQFGKKRKQNKSKKNERMDVPARN